MEALIQAAIKKHASDVFFIAGMEPVVRIDGSLEPLQKKKLTKKDIELYFLPKLTSEQKELYKEVHDVDFRFTIKKRNFRVNIHKQQSGIGVALRIFPATIPTPEEINLSTAEERVKQMNSGLVLVTGPSGSGKSTTIATLLQQINLEQAKHIITIENPIEYIFENDKSYFEQREVMVDTPSFHSALKHVLRQNPDIVFIGEMRDQKSVAAALTAAETGHLVFSTLHTPSAADTVERIIDLFPHEDQNQILIQLSSVLRMVISQRLYPRLDGGRIAAREIMINNSAIANLIRNNNIPQMNSVIQTSRKEGMFPMKKAVQVLIENNIIDPAVVD